LPRPADAPVPAPVLVEGGRRALVAREPSFGGRAAPPSEEATGDAKALVIPRLAKAARERREVVEALEDAATWREVAVDGEHRLAPEERARPRCVREEPRRPAGVTAPVGVGHRAAEREEPHAERFGEPPHGGPLVRVAGELEELQREAWPCLPE